MNEPEAMPGSTYQGAALTSREHADGDTIMANLRCSYTEKLSAEAGGKYSRETDRWIDRYLSIYLSIYRETVQNDQSQQ